MSGVAVQEVLKVAGRNPKPYRTKQVRVSEKAADLIAELAPLAGFKDVPALCQAWLVPILEKEIDRALEKKLQQRKEQHKKEGKESK
jgi:hypothetical protein